MTATEAFFGKTIGHLGQSPEILTLDEHAASHRAVHHMTADSTLTENTKV